MYHLLAMWVSGPCRSVQLLGQDVRPAAAPRAWKDWCGGKEKVLFLNSYLRIFSVFASFLCCQLSVFCSIAVTPSGGKFDSVAIWLV